ncbi:hypothetical protein JZU68_06180, partial [bacterium]|nr:hypothetical protein [bacterium]
SDFLDKNFAPIVLIVIGAFFGFFLPLLWEKIKEHNKRKKILVALRRQVEALPRFSLYNKTATEQATPEHIVPMFYPTAPFEFAIFSENGISITEETLQATIDYLIKAIELNAVIRILQDTFNSLKENETFGSRPQAKKFLFDQVTNQAEDYYMHRLIKKLKTQIEKEQDYSTRIWRYIKDTRLRGKSK